MKHKGDIDYTLSAGLDDLDRSLSTLRESNSLHELEYAIQRLHNTLEQFANDDIMDMINEIADYCAEVKMEVESIGEVMDFDY